MNRWQKIAWFGLIVILISLILSVILTFYYVQKYDYSHSEASGIATGYPAVLLISIIFAPLIFRKTKGKVDMDERDLIIGRKAALVTYCAAFAFFVIVFVIICVSVGMENLIPVYWLARVLLGAWIFTMIVHASTVLILYGRANKGVENE